MVTMPPSPRQPRFLLGKNEKHPMAPKLPARLPLSSAPMAWAQSSITGTFPAAAMTACMSAHWP